MRLGSRMRAGYGQALRVTASSAAVLALAMTGAPSAGAAAAQPGRGSAGTAGRHADAARPGEREPALSTPACTDTWIGLSGGNWSTAADWSTGAVPGPSDVACITKAGASSYTVVLKSGTNVAGLMVGAPSGTTKQTLEVEADGGTLYLDLNGPSTVNQKGVLVMTSAGWTTELAGTGSLDNYGQLETVTGAGGGREFYLDIVNEPGGKMSIGSGAGATDQRESSLTNEGTLTVQAGSYFDFDPQGNGAFTQAGGTIANKGTLEVDYSTITQSGGTETGNPIEMYGDTLNDSAGPGGYTVLANSTLSGKIPRGQTVTVDGNSSTGVTLLISGNVANHGTFVMTSDASTGGGNTWVEEVSGTTPTFKNYGTFETVQGDGWTRYIWVKVINEPGGTMDLGAADNILTAGFTLTNDGTLGLADGVDLYLEGASNGNADYVQGSGGTLGIVVDSTSNTVSAIIQPTCGAAACVHQDIAIAGTLDITTVGSAAGTWVPLASGANQIIGTFSTVNSSVAYTVTYDGGPDQGDVTITS